MIAGAVAFTRTRWVASNTDTTWIPIHDQPAPGDEWAITDEWIAVSDGLKPQSDPVKKEKPPKRTPPKEPHQRILTRGKQRRTLQPEPWAPTYATPPPSTESVAV